MEVIIQVRTGSHMYGTQTPTSDEDFVGVFMPNKRHLFGFDTTDYIDKSIVHKHSDGKNTKDAVDEIYHEFRKFVKLAMDANPNIIELLFVERKNIVHINDIGEKLLQNRDMFLSKLVIKKFLGYAKGQKHKMRIKLENYHALKEAKMFLEDNEFSTKALIGDEHQKGTLAKIFKDERKFITVGDLKFNKHLKLKTAQERIIERLNKFSNRESLILEHGYDTKFASHLIRLLVELRDLLIHKKITFPLPEKDLLLEIKQGKLPMEAVLALATALEEDLEILAKKTDLPDKPDYDKIERFQIETIINKLYADAIAKYTGDWVPQIIMGGSGKNTGGGNGATDLINLLTAKTAKDLNLDLGVKK